VKADSTMHAVPHLAAIWRRGLHIPRDTACFDGSI
jgi:hypothetical protein